MQVIVNKVYTAPAQLVRRSAIQASAAQASQPRSLDAARPTGLLDLPAGGLPGPLHITSITHTAVRAASGFQFWQVHTRLCNGLAVDWMCIPSCTLRGGGGGQVGRRMGRRAIQRPMHKQA